MKQFSPDQDKPHKKYCVIAIFPASNSLVDFGLNWRR